MYRTHFWTLWEKARVGYFERIALKHVYYLGWNRSPAQVGCMRQVLGLVHWEDPEGLGREGGGRGESGWGIHVNPWLIHVNVWQKPLQYCKVISLQLIKINEKKIFLKSSSDQPLGFWASVWAPSGLGKLIPGELCPTERGVGWFLGEVYF